MGAMSISHWLIVLLVVLLVFGPKRLSGIGKSLGQGVRGLREGLSGESDKDDSDGAPRAHRTTSDDKADEKAV